MATRPTGGHQAPRSAGQSDGLMAAQERRQLGDVNRNPSRLIFAEKLGCIGVTAHDKPVDCCTNKPVEFAASVGDTQTKMPLSPSWRVPFAPRVVAR